MAIETRPNYTVEAFATNSATGEKRIFGNDTNDSDNIDDQKTAEFLRGWAGGLDVNGFPPMEYFNALGFTLGKYIAYLYQAGIPTWSGNQDYYINSHVIGSDGNIYKAITGVDGSANTGNNPVGDATNWEKIGKDFVDLTQNQTVDGIKTFSSFPITPSANPTSNYQVSNKKYVDDKAGGYIPFGVGSRASAIANADTIVLGGFYSAPDTWVGSPVSGQHPDNQGNLIHIPNHVSGYETQYFSQMQKNVNRIRHKNNGVWSSWVEIATSDNSFAQSQTWQDVTASRAMNVTYTNSTGKAIALTGLFRNSSENNTSVRAIINGEEVDFVFIQTSGLQGGGAGSVIIPNGATYLLALNAGTPSIVFWSELR